MKYTMTKGNGLYHLVDCLKYEEKEKINREGGKEINGLKSDLFLPPQAHQKAQSSPCADQVKTTLKQSKDNHQVECGRERDTERRWYALWLV